MSVDFVGMTAEKEMQVHHTAAEANGVRLQDGCKRRCGGLRWAAVCSIQAGSRSCGCVEQRGMQRTAAGRRAQGAGRRAR